MMTTSQREKPAVPAGSSEAGLPPRVLYGGSEAMRTVREKVERVAHTNVPVLIVGESGTGKEVIARHIHALSQWRDGPFLRINCPAIPGSLLESELFGHEQGAFTGASTPKAGLVECASDGTLFLDSIDELDLSLQSKLLQFLQDGEFTRIGGRENMRADVRIICAASHNLEHDIEAGAFRRDLFYRINVVTVHLPPLRERREDIPQLTDHFFQAFSAEFGTATQPLSPSVRDMLVASDWPGNIRQLQNVIKRYVILGTEDAILAELGARTLTAAGQGAAGEPVFLKELVKRASAELERKVIMDVLSANQFNRRKTARALHISYRALLMKMKQTGLPAKKPKYNGRGESQEQ